MLYSTLLRHPRVAASALAALVVVVGCGGPNLSDKERGARINATPSSEDDDPQPENDVDAAAPVVEQDAGTTTPEPVADSAPPVDAAPPVPAGSFAVGTELETISALNLREGPGTQFAIIVEIPAATRVKVVKISGADGWVNISYDGKTGYSSKDFLKTVP